MTQGRPAAIRGVVAIIRLEQIYDPDVLVGALAAGGIRYVEFTLNSGGALEAIDHAARCAIPGVAIGAGTVTTPGEVAEIAEAGATFCVSPHADVSIIRACHEADVLPVPGAFTPTEIMQAVRAGARSIKIFPVGVVGPPLVQALRGPFAEVDLIPTGGIPLVEVGDYRRAGAAGVGLGSDLVGTGRDAEALTASARRAVEAWDSGFSPA